MIKRFLLSLMMLFMCVCPLKAETEGYYEEFVDEGKQYVYQLLDGIGTLTAIDIETQTQEIDQAKLSIQKY